MGIDKSLTDDFPSVYINGRRYHYGREPDYGQYLVENAEYAKDYWCFDRKEDMLAFLTNLPESADRELFAQRHPDWEAVPPEQRDRYLEEHRAFLRERAEERRRAGTAGSFNVLQFSEDGEYASAYARPLAWGFCDDLDLRVREQQVSGTDRSELLVELRVRPKDDETERRTFTICREQALRLASALIRAAEFIERRPPARG